MERKLLGMFFLAVYLSSCAPSIKEVGRVNMISVRNVDPKLEYGVLSTYSGGSKRELKKTRATSIDEALRLTVRKVPGGEFLMNARLYQVRGKYFAMEGDVWGYKDNSAYRGFRIGDKVFWKTAGGIKSGVVKALKDDQSCIIETEGGALIEKKYDALSKSE
jgi:hypothetical protein